MFSTAWSFGTAEAPLPTKLREYMSLRLALSYFLSLYNIFVLGMALFGRGINEILLILTIINVSIAKSTEMGNIYRGIEVLLCHWKSILKETSTRKV